MKDSRRIKRMSRGKGKKKVPSMNLVSLMDVFTILVFFLLVNSSTTEELSDPKSIELPESVSESKPEQTIVLMVTPTNILIRGESIAVVEDILAQKELVVNSIRAALIEEAERNQSLSTQSQQKRKEITIMGDRQIPFKLLKKVMASCTSAGFEKISLAVVQKASQAS